ncbi:MAG: sodium:proton antiporter [Alphaproteobacteria bacterium]
MTLLTALVFGILFGAGVHLMVRRDAFKLVGGTVLLGNAAVFLLMAGTFDGSEAAILPVDDPSTVADPLVQALALTALVISFATTVLLLRVALAVERTHGTLDMEDLVRAEVADQSDPEDDEAGRPS